MLKRLGIVVESREDEKTSAAGILDRMNEKNQGVNLIVVLNLDCNFACTYCYEGDMKGRLYMSEDTAGLLIKFVKDKFTPGKKWLNIDFFGGEPLLSLQTIRRISSELRSFAESRSASFTFSLTTNGSLFTKKTVVELGTLGLKVVKITIDGPPEIHNRCRPFKSGAGSFETIIRNINETCDLIKVGVGGNFQQENYREFPRLLDRFEKEGLTPQRLYQVKFEPVMKRLGGDCSPSDFSDGCMSASEPWLIEAGAFLREEVLKRGYHTPKLTPMPCQVELRDFFVVNYDGILYKCPGFIGRAGFDIGDLERGIGDYSASYKPGIWKNEECLNCEYLPLCFGGCRYLACAEKGRIEKECRRAYYDASLETLIKQDLKYRKPAAG